MMALKNKGKSYPVGLDCASRQAGFTLFELAVSITILGIFFSGALIGVTQFLQAQKIKVTHERIDLINNALSTYVQTNYRLPCPADPGAAAAQQGMEGNAGNCFTTASTSDLYWNNEGIVPWKELGIPKDMVVDGWNHYITYKPAPNLTMDMLSNELQGVGQPSGTAYIHNACRTGMWYDSYGNHINRAKALFCCSAGPNPAYLAKIGQPTVMPANWRANGVVDTDTATNLAGNNLSVSGLPAGTQVMSSNTWHDDNSKTSANLMNTNGEFDQSNYIEPYPDSPLLRASSNAVTLISHGSNGLMSFLDKQTKDKRLGGTIQQNGTGAPAGAGTEVDNAWPPQAYAAVAGHPKVNGTYDVMGMLTNTSDDIVSNLRTDQIYAKVGSASCQYPPNVGFAPYSCQSQQLNDAAGTLVNPTTGASFTVPRLYSLQLALTAGQKYKLQSQFIAEASEAGYHNSVGFYTVGSDGTIQAVQLSQPDVHNFVPGEQQSFESSVDAGTKGVGIFVIANGANVNSNYSGMDLSAHSADTLKFYYHYGQADQRLANITDTEPPTLVIEKANGTKQVIHGADGSNPYHMYSNLNDGLVNRNLRPENITSTTALKSVGVDVNGFNLKVGFEDLSKINCYYDNSGACKNGLADSDKKSDGYGGYIANIGDNDYDDADFTFNLVACPAGK